MDGMYLIERKRYPKNSSILESITTKMDARIESNSSLSYESKRIYP
jgi:hypothetical protein